VTVEVKVPVLAESIAEATLMKWHRKVGDAVSRGDSLIDIETDKVTLEVAAPHDGVLSEILKQDGEDVQSEEVIARIDTGTGKPASAESEKNDTVTTPSASEKKPAEEPRQQSLPSLDEDNDAGVGKSASPKLSPAVRNLLQKHHLDAADINPATPGRITKEDVLQHIGEVKAPAAEKPATDKKPDNKQPESKASPPVKPATMTSPPLPAASTSGDRPEERVPMTRLRKRAAERLLGAQHDNAILTTFNEINMQPVIDLRNRYRQEFEDTHGVKLGFMSFFTKAAVESLKKFPVINASVEGDDIIYHGYFDIGIAVSSPRGLVVPVVRDADILSFAQVEQTIRELGNKAHDGKLAMEDLTGGTFTITNGGVFGSLLSTPIINPPQSAILGMHAMQERPVAENGNVVIRPMMYVALSYDHRIIDGREAVQFLVTLKEMIEDPTRLLLQV